MMPQHLPDLIRPGFPRLTRVSVWILLAALFAAMPTFAADAPKKDPDKDTYDQDSIIKDAAEFFGQTTEGLAKVIEKAFKDHGRPNAYIKGEEAGGAITVGLRYGNGTLQM